MDLKLKNKTVFISASNQGIGASIAQCFLDEGAFVIINGRSPQKTEKYYNLLRKKYKNKISYFCGDMTKTKVLKSLKKSIQKKFTSLDILITNLGSGKPNSKNWLDKKEWQRFYEINTLSSVELINVLLPLMKQKNKKKETLTSGWNDMGKCIIILSSIAAQERIKAPYAYSASKAALTTLVSHLTPYLAQSKIRINAVLPGNVYFKGGRWEEILSVNPELLSNYIKVEVPLKRLAQPSEIAQAVVFLASPVSSFTTGASLVIDGGQTRSFK